MEVKWGQVKSILSRRRGTQNVTLAQRVGKITLTVVKLDL